MVKDARFVLIMIFVVVFAFAISFHMIYRGRLLGFETVEAGVCFHHLM